MSPSCENELGKKFLDTHVAEWGKSGMNAGTPYWDQPPETEFYESFRRGKFEITSGTSASFPNPKKAVIIENGLDVYINGGLFRGNPDDIKQKVMPYFIAGFTPRHHLISIYDHEQKETVGGCMVVLGAGQQSLLRDVGSPNTTLSTNFALNYKLPEKLEAIPVSQVACFMRFHHIIREMPNEYWGAVIREILSAMGRMVGVMNEISGSPILGILDTHDPKVASLMSNKYGAYLLDDRPTVTPQMKNHPLSAHYNMEGIQVLACQSADLYRVSREVDEQLGPKTIVRPLDYF